ncbi:hypothetical protein [Buttiauxella noackiae]|uniref:hypothetical protein n=1 Tax=Buttiauxella noackiae TaxID=82992 RepID=UPI0028D0A3BE|nr:hypothetical protein [Buttiauxella noackiae]
MLGIALKLLKANWKSLLVAAVLLGGGVWFGTFITDKQLSEQALAFSGEKERLNNDFNSQKTLWDQERLAASGRYAADLKAALDTQNAWHKKADDLSVQLAAQESEHSRTVTNLKRRLNDAITRDGTDFTGIGPHGLQLWREALGYASDENLTAGHGLSEAASGDAGPAGDAASTRGGLSPAGIVSYSAEYGRWCLILRDRLQALNDYYR